MTLFKIRSFLRRNDLTIGFSIMAIALGTILYVQAVATSKLQEQVQGQQQILAQIKTVTEQLKQTDQSNKADTDEINRHLDCIVEFFSQTDRTQKAIANIDACTFKNLNTGATQNHTSTGVQPSPANVVPVPQPTSSNSVPTTQPVKQNPQPTHTATPRPITNQSLLKDIVSPIENLTKSLSQGVQ